MENTDYTVEKIIQKRFRNGQAEFRIKWEGFTHRHNTWEPRRNLTDCEIAIDEFELQWARDIVGMQGNDFILRFKCGEIRQISFDEAKKNWPKLLKGFCTKNPGFGICFAGSEQINAPKNKNAKKKARAMSVTSSDDSTSNDENSSGLNKSHTNQSMIPSNFGTSDARSRVISDERTSKDADILVRKSDNGGKPAKRMTRSKPVFAESSQSASGESKNRSGHDSTESNETQANQCSVSSNPNSSVSSNSSGSGLGLGDNLAISGDAANNALQGVVSAHANTSNDLDSVVNSDFNNLHSNQSLVSSNVSTSGVRSEISSKSACVVNDKENDQSKKLRFANADQPFSIFSDGLPIDLSEHNNSLNSDTVMSPASLYNIMKDLHGLGFSPYFKKKRPVPKLLSVAAIPDRVEHKDAKDKVVHNRKEPSVDQLRDNLDDFHLHYM